ncbi:MAG: porin family protein [Bacteroides sp.]
MKRTLLLFIAVITCLFIYPQDEKTVKRHSIVNFGMKGGFNSTMYFVDQFKIQDVTIEKIQNNYKVGYSGTIFLRINMKRNFIQPELSYNVSKSEIAFDKKGTQHPDIKPDYATISSTIRMVEFPLLYGYNFIKNGPYGMNFLIGPKLKYIWQQKSELDFENFDQEGIHEKLYPFNISGVIGLSVNISNVFFDFRYEVGLHNISKYVVYDNLNAEGQERISNIIFHRRSNALSFSLGFIF